MKKTKEKRGPSRGRRAIYEDKLPAEILEDLWDDDHSLDKELNGVLSDGLAYSVRETSDIESLKSRAPRG